MNDGIAYTINGQRIPIVAAVRTTDGTGFKFPCLYCGCWHFHGAGEGHRVAHCFVDDSPYQDTGYILQEVEEIIPPRRQFKPVYTKSGKCLSGFLASQRKGRS